VIHGPRMAPFPARASLQRQRERECPDRQDSGAGVRQLVEGGERVCVVDKLCGAILSACSVLGAAERQSIQSPGSQQLWPPKRSHAAIHGRRLGHRRSDTRGAPAHWPKVSPCRAKRGRERSVLKDSFSGQAGRWACKGGTTTQTPSCGGHTTATHHFIQTAIRKSPCRAASTGLQRRQTLLAPRCQTPAEEQNLPSLFHVATWTNRLLLRGVIRNNAARLQSFLASHRAAATKDARAAFVQSSIVPLLAAGDHTQYSVHTKV
jgi:hypothetical protein